MVLYLPKGVKAYMDMLSIKKNITTGKLLVDIVCQFAWDDGYLCDHPKIKNLEKIEDVERSRHSPSLYYFHKVRCMICGKIGITARSISSRDRLKEDHAMQLVKEWTYLSV